MSSEGSREIEAAKKRLAAAKEQVSGASDMTKKADAMMEIAKKNMKAAKSMKQSADSKTAAANKEVEDAQKILADAEKRWDVIEIDQEPDITVNEGGNKRRKLATGCKKRAAELYDEKWFKEPPPPREECPICMLPLPLYVNHTGMTFKPCCGKNICLGCVDTMMESGGTNKDLCAFCRTLRSRSGEEEVNRVKKLVDAGNARACHQLAGYYDRGIRGFPQDSAKTNELLLKAGQLGYADAYYNLGNQYFNGRGVTVDKKKARHYYEIAALNGDVQARHYLGCSEGQDGNHQRAFKHFIIAARAGSKRSLDKVKKGYRHGDVTKDEYANTLREYQKSQDEMKSDARDKALAYHREIDLE